MLALNVCNVVHKLVNILRVSFWGKIVRTNITAERVNFYVREISKLGRYLQICAVCARIRCANLIDNATAETPDVCQNIFSRIEGTSACELALRFDRIYLWCPKLIVECSASDLVFCEVQIRIDCKIVLIGKIRCDASVLPYVGLRLPT